MHLFSETVLQNFDFDVLVFFFIFFDDWIEFSESELSDIIFVLVFDFFVCTAVVTIAPFLKRLLACLFSNGLVFCICVFRGISVKLVLC